MNPAVGVMMMMIMKTIRKEYKMTERTKIPALNDEGRFVYEDLTDDGKRYETYLDNTKEVFPKTFEQFMREGL